MAFDLPERRRLTRHVMPRLKAALAESPAVLLQGPWRCGKTQLGWAALSSPNSSSTGRISGGPGALCFDFSNDEMRDHARMKPDEFFASMPKLAILNEIQLVPDMYPPLVEALDRARTPGQIILTASTDTGNLPVSFVSRLPRLPVLPLHPLSQCELAAPADPLGAVSPIPVFLDALFCGVCPKPVFEPNGASLLDRIVAGSFPEALALPDGIDRTRWHHQRMESLLKSDLLGPPQIQGSEDLLHLLAIVAGQSSERLNLKHISNYMSLSRSKTFSCLRLLEQRFLLQYLPAWDPRGQSSSKTPKLYIGDTGIACYLLHLNSEMLTQLPHRFKPLLRTFVFLELQRQASGADAALKFFHYRDRRGVGAELVIERARDGAVVGVDVIPADRVSEEDFQSLRQLAHAAKSRFTFGAVLYNGADCVPFGKKMFAVPIRHLWDAR